MRTRSFGWLAALAWMLTLQAPVALASDTLQPYVLAYVTQVPLEEETTRVESRLQQAGFTIVGRYSPYSDAQVIGITSTALQQAAAQTPGGALAAATHVALTVVNGSLQVSYLNPAYLAAAYRLAGDLSPVAAVLEQALGAEKTFGAKGLSREMLQRYRYVVGMESFETPYRLGKHASYEVALKTVEANLKQQVGGAALVYRVEIPGKQQTLFGISRAQVGDKRANDKHILADTVDQQFEIKTTAYLPYQLLVEGPEVLAPHMRFRMAVWHPDLTMVTFGKLMSSPGAVEDLLRQIAGTPKGFSF